MFPVRSVNQRRTPVVILLESPEILLSFWLVAATVRGRFDVPVHAVNIAVGKPFRGINPHRVASAFFFFFCYLRDRVYISLY